MKSLSLIVVVLASIASSAPIKAIKNSPVLKQIHTLETAFKMERGYFSPNLSDIGFDIPKTHFAKLTFISKTEFEAKACELKTNACLFINEQGLVYDSSKYEINQTDNSNLGFNGEIAKWTLADNPFADRIFKAQEIGAKLEVDGWMNNVFENYQIDSNFGVSDFQIFHNCGKQKKDFRPTVANCGSTVIKILKKKKSENTLTFIRGTIRIKGIYTVKGCSGPYQGVMECILESTK